MSTTKHTPEGIAKGALGIEWRDTETAARLVATYAARQLGAHADMLEALEQLLAASNWEPSEPLTSEAIHRIAAAQGKAQNAITKARGGAA